MLQPPLTVAENAPCNPLEFSVNIRLPEELPLDEVVLCRRQVANYGTVCFYGVVDATDMQGGGYQARVRITRIDPEVFVPPLPGSVVERADASAQSLALHFDGMRGKMPVGLLAGGLPAFANIEFLSGQKGAHANIGGISGVATKTSYALFLLHSLFHNTGDGQSRAIVFNVKGDDLLYLHKPNRLLQDSHRRLYQKLGLPAQPFGDVGYHGVEGPLWSMRQFAERELIRFLFAESVQSPTLEFAVDRLAEVLKDEAAKKPGPELNLFGTTIPSISQLSQLICGTVDDPMSIWFETVADNTRRALVRRLKAVAPQLEALLGEVGSFNYDRQLNVVDLHRLTDKAKSFVVGAILKTLYEGRESHPDDHPTVYLVLDELNKYAPKESRGAIGEMLLDVAERGRSLGIVLIGAQQTASQVEERVVGNAALRIVGRLENSESSKDTYGWLTSSFRRRACQLQPGTMLISQPQVPVPLLVRFPLPAWATRRSEAES